MLPEVIRFVLLAGLISWALLWVSRSGRKKPTDRTGPGLPEARGREPDKPATRTFGKAGPRPAPAAQPDHAAEFRRMAEDRDNAHKARLRAHVERAVPPITESGREAIERARREWLAIRHVFPPRLPQRSMSYFGGLPIVPDEFDWPTVHNRKGLLERLNFVAQIDCSTVPPGHCRDLLPDKGYLYFFAPLADSFGADARHFVCRYEQGPVRKDWSPLDMPFTGTVQSDDPVEAAWRGKRTHFDRVEIELGWLAEPTDEEVAARGEEGYPFEVAETIRREKLDAFFGPRHEPVPAPPAGAAPREGLQIPYEGFPTNWMEVRILERLALAYHREETTDVAERLEKMSPVPDDHPEAIRLSALKSDLSSFSAKIRRAFFNDARLKDHETVPEERRREVRAFLEDLRADGMPSSKERRYLHRRLPLVIDSWMSAAALRGGEAALLDKDSAPLVAPEVMAELARRHSARNHRMLGAGELVQTAAEDMKDRYLLLLQLAPDAALGWTVGEMGPLQYWITPEDLAARRFENTVLTIEAY
ncbi:MAG TPA: DUF1963 domain-containing protein [Allosphingosinicella sp.]|jgi:uncharacterized protein YwqG|nr:DUF1963 domain-containing protein [Allosphingosinicella sp.]